MSKDMSSSQKVSCPMVALTIASLFLMAALDYVTGQELVFSCAYLVPVSMAAWWVNRRWMIVMSVASAITALIVDEFDGYDYSHHSIEYWNAFACFLICIVTGLILSRLKQTLLDREEANQELRTALEKLEASTVEIRKLQSGLQTVCAWTQRIKVGKEWMSPDEFLSSQLHLKLTHDISPEAFREMQKDLSSAA
jgi:hypothetical protein